MMDAPPKLLPARATVYKGIRMRSRMEATFAAALDTAEVEWEYEPQVFADETRQWLPDFFIRRLDYTVWVELKPTREHALAAVERVHVIFESIPEALVIIAWPGEPDDGWMGKADPRYHMIAISYGHSEEFTEARPIGRPD